MPTAAGPSEQDLRSGENSTPSETSTLIPKPTADEENGEVVESWSPSSLGPGFIWIETGEFS